MAKIREYAILVYFMSTFSMCLRLEDFVPISDNFWNVSSIINTFIWISFGPYVSEKPNTQKFGFQKSF